MLTYKERDSDRFKNTAEISSFIFSTLASNLDIPVQSSTRENLPINEFAESELILTHGYPHIFVFGNAYKPSSGRMSPLNLKERTHLLLQYTTAAAQDKLLIFFLFNQMLRHSNIRAMKIRLRTNKENLHKVCTLIKDDNFDAKINDAIKYPDGKNAQDIAKTIIPLLSISKNQAPFGYLDHKDQIGKIYNQVRRYGPATNFVTFNFDDVSSPNVLRMALPSTTNFEYPALSSKKNFVALRENGKMENPNIDFSWYERNKIVNNNPVATAHEYMHNFNAMMELIIGIKSEDQYKREDCLLTKTKGIFGKTLGSTTAHETHQKGTLHGHIITFGQLSSKLLTLAATEPSIKIVMTTVMNNMYHGQMSRTAHIERLINRFMSTNHMKRKNHYIHPITTIAPKVDSIDQNDSNFNSYVHHRVIMNNNMHDSHSFTCHHGLQGRHGCRLSMPAGKCEKTSPVQLESPSIDNEEDVIKGYKVLPNISIFDANYLPHLPLLPIKDPRTIVWEIERPLLGSFPLIDESITKPNDILALIPIDPIYLSSFIDHHPSLDDTKKLYQFIQENLSDRNLSVVQYNPLLSSLIGANTAVYHLGNETQSTNALCYIAPYISKNNVPIAECISTIKTSLKKVKEYPSTAKDTGTDDRDTIYFMQKLINQLDAKMEVSDVQASAAVLGMKSMPSSDIYTWYGGHEHMKYIRHIQNNHCTDIDEKSKLNSHMNNDSNTDNDTDIEDTSTDSSIDDHDDNSDVHNDNEYDNDSIPIHQLETIMQSTSYPMNIYQYKLYEIPKPHESSPNINDNTTILNLNTNNINITNAINATNTTNNINPSQRTNITNTTNATNPTNTTNISRTINSSKRNRTSWSIIS